MTALLLFIGAARHYGYALAPPDAQGDAWNIAGSLTVIALILLAMRGQWSPLSSAVALWFIGEEMLVVACSSAWLVQPWAVQPGDEQCSARIGLKLGAFGLLCIAVFAWKLAEPVRGDSTNSGGGV